MHDAILSLQALSATAFPFAILCLLAIVGVADLVARIRSTVIRRRANARRLDEWLEHARRYELEAMRAREERKARSQELN